VQKEDVTWWASRFLTSLRQPRPTVAEPA
jgi:trehalose 6-phosphate synthase